MSYEPILDTARCVQKLPKHIRTWVQPTVSERYDHPDLQWIRVNRKSGNASPPGRSILAFWCHDRDFEEFLRLVDRRTRRLVAEGVKTTLTPDISIYWRDPKVAAQVLFRAQLRFGRLMQNKGMTIIPNAPLLHPSYAAELYEQFLPVGLPLGVQIQTAMRPQLGVRDAKCIGLTAECFTTILEVSRSPEILVYGARSVFEAIASHLPSSAPLRFVQCISDIMNDVSRFGLNYDLLRSR
jgi:hypothetical protein